MSTRSDLADVLAANESRQSVCECLGDALRAGDVNFRFSFLRRNSMTRGLSVHAFHNHFWICLDVLAPGDATNCLWERLTKAAERGAADEWNCRRIEYPGQTDIEVNLHSLADTHHLADVEGLLDRLLFQDRNVN